MSGSLSARERANPPPRRKSCTACIKAKRRCDFALPACLRCSQRSIACEYAGRRMAAQRGGGGGGGGGVGIGEASDSVVVPLDLTPSRFQDQFYAKTMSPPQPPMSPSALLHSPSSLMLALQEQPLSDNLLDALDPSCLDMAGWDGAAAAAAAAAAPLTELVHPSTAVTAPTTRDLEVQDIIAQRLRFAIDEIKHAPVSMILETQTPWCHPLLYKDGMPKSMQDAHASCALYIAKNRVNGPVILQAIASRAHELVSSSSSSSEGTTLPSILAHTQSLVLYQIMRLFDGDMSARSSAERLMPYLEESAMCLLAHVRFDVSSSPEEELPLYPLAPTTLFWREWILHESARRTVLFCFFLVQAYKLVSGQKGLMCDGRLGLCHSWTMSDYLWTAASPVQFARAWRDRRHFVIRDAQFSEVLGHAGPDDVGRFGRMWISTLLGVDEAEGWFASRGGCLELTS